MTFRHTLRVRFSDEDHAQMVYYPRFFHFFHVAFEEFFEHEGVPYRVALDEGIGWPAAHAEADYLVPVRFGDDLTIEVDVTRVGTKSATFRYAGRVGDEERVRGTVTVVCVDLATKRSLPIPDKYRAIFARHQVESLAQGRS